MENPTELGDFTLKQLLHLYQISETGRPSRATEQGAHNGLVSDKDVALFRKIMSGTSGKNGTDEHKDNNLAEIFNGLIDDIDSTPSS